MGTALHVFIGMFVVALFFEPTSPVAATLPSTGTRRLLVAALFVGSAILVALSPLGRRSGGHLNPAISIAFWIRGRLTGPDTVGYVAAQCIGALVAARVAVVLAPGTLRSVGYAVTKPGPHVSAPEVALLEAVAASFVVVVMLSLLATTRTARYTLLGVWASLCLYVWLLAPVTGASVNPARSLGPAVTAHHLAGYWAYLVGPISGAALAATVWTAIGMPRTLTCKLSPGSAPTGSER